MRVFLSWSGERSKAVAAALRDWLPLILRESDAEIFAELAVIPVISEEMSEREVEFCEEQNHRSREEVDAIVRRADHLRAHLR